MPRRIAWFNLAMLLVLSGCSGCRRSAVDNTTTGTQNPTTAASPPLPQVDRPAIEKLNKPDLQQLASAADRYCQALARLGGRVSITVNLSHASLTDAEMSKLAFPAATTAINLSNTAIGDDSVASLASVTGLKTLILGYTKVTDRSLTYLQQFPQLTMVELTATGVSDEASTAVISMVEARAAESRATSPTAPTGWVFDQAAAEAAKNAVEEMDRYAEALAKFGGKVSVHVDLSRLGITDADVQRLPLAYSVRDMDLSFTLVTDRSLVHLKDGANLERIGLNNTAITEAGVQTLILMPHLREAVIEGTNIPFNTQLELLKALTSHVDKSSPRGR